MFIKPMKRVRYVNSLFHDMPEDNGGRRATQQRCFGLKTCYSIRQLLFVTLVAGLILAFATDAPPYQAGCSFYDER